jgi:hypothetical protein
VASSADNNAPAKEPTAAPPAPAGSGPGVNKPAAQANVSPAKLQALQKYQGSSVTFGDGSEWIMERDGSVHQVH